VIEGSLADIAVKTREAGIGRQALIIVGNVLKARSEGMKARSLLYDGGFTHGFRKGIAT
jgi:precorrin-4/cobalt-precorrin-4 C11-methyltransferase